MEIKQHSPEQVNKSQRKFSKTLNSILNNNAERIYQKLGDTKKALHESNLQQ